MSRYDGPSIFKNNQSSQSKASFSPNPKNQVQKSVAEPNNKNQDKKPPLLKEKKTEPKTKKQWNQSIQQTPKKSHLFRGSNFRAREIPSPMFGYSEEQKERMNKEKGKKKLRNWDYQKLGERVEKADDDYLLFDTSKGQSGQKDEEAIEVDVQSLTLAKKNLKDTRLENKDNRSTPPSTKKPQTPNPKKT